MDIFQVLRERNYHKLKKFDHNTLSYALNEDDETPLIFAIRFRDEEGFRTLLELGADVEARDSSAFTALLWACYFTERDKFVYALLDIGADANVTSDTGVYPLYTAVTFKKSEIVRALLQKGARMKQDEFWAAVSCGCPKTFVAFEEIYGELNDAEKALVDKYKMKALLK